VFYRRFLATHPEAGPAAAATEAIDTCATTQPSHPTTSAKAEAKHRIDLATTLHQGGDFPHARSELVVAYALDPDPSVLFAIGQLDVKLGQCGDAILLYERFIAANPELAESAGATEAIEACKTTLATPAVTAAAGVTAAPQPTVPPRRWYADPIGVGLLGGGLVLTVVSGLTYRAALADLDDAEAATSYDRHAELVDNAHGKRTYAAMFAVGAVALTGASVVRFVMHRRSLETRGVAIVPTPDGGLVAWSGSF
jgi:hypothetical protein